MLILKDIGWRKRKLIAIDKDTQQTEMPGVFAGGDAANGPATVIETIAAGRHAAIFIDKCLGGDGELEGGSEQPHDGGQESRNPPLPAVRFGDLPGQSITAWRTMSGKFPFFPTQDPPTLNLRSRRGI